MRLRVGRSCPLPTRKGQGAKGKTWGIGKAEFGTRMGRGQVGTTAHVAKAGAEKAQVGNGKLGPLLQKGPSSEDPKVDRRQGRGWD
jgi:hypothetical protein